MWSQEQLLVLKDTHPTKQIIAAAGSGKTTTLLGILEHKEKDPQFSPNNCLVVTFTKKATREFRIRSLDKGLSSQYTISTFHAFCYQELRRYDPHFQQTGLRLLTTSEKEHWTKEFLYPHRHLVGGIPFSLLWKDEGAIFKQISKEVYHGYRENLEHFKKTTKRFEFDDLPKAYLHCLRSPFGPELKKKIQTLIIDEFQDTDPIQMEIVLEIAPKELVVVGDDWQSIYGFRGADPSGFVSFPKFFPQVKQYKLSTNYRSTSDLVRFSKRPILKNKNQIAKQVISGKNGRGSIQLIPTEDNWEVCQEHWKRISLKVPNLKLLVRSNFRKKFWSECKVSNNQMATIHSAKGLEFESVAVDLLSGWPEVRDPSHLEEERRILYVALSRAKHRLVIFLPKSAKPSDLPGILAGDIHFSSFLRNLTLRLTSLW